MSHSSAIQISKQHHNNTSPIDNNQENSNKHNRWHSRMSEPNLPRHSVIQPTIIFIVFLLIIINNIQSTLQQNNAMLCPKVCICDEQTLETTCKGSFVASGIPHTLNPSTKRITINHAQLTLFSGVDWFSNLEVLDLAHNRISAIDFDLIKLNTHLISLNASHNSITDLRDSSVAAVLSKSESNLGGDDSEKLKALRKSKINVIELTLSNNHLTILKNYTFGRWSKLQRLDLSYNDIVFLESESLFGLTKLEHISLRGNRLVQVPGLALQGTTRSLGYSSPANEQLISQLKSLELSENPLTSLEPYSFSTLGQLQEIHLDSCLLQSIHDQAFLDLNNLHLLSMTHNDLTEIPSYSLNVISSLKSLKMSSNKIEFLPPNSFKNLFNLEELELNNGSFRELQPQAFRGLISLKKLEISRNINLTKVYPQIFIDLPKLVHLNLSMGSLRSLPIDDDMSSHPLLLLDLRNNSLICDCKLKWLTKQFKRFNQLGKGRTSRIIDSSLIRIEVLEPLMIDKILNVTCAGPPALSGKQVIDLPDNNLECIRPTSKLNVNIGFASLFIMTLLLTTVCMINFCRDERHFMGILKENLVQGRLSMALRYSQDLHKNVDNYKIENQLECAEYEQVDYGQNNGPIYTIPSDQYVLRNSSQQRTHQL